MRSCNKSVHMSSVCEACQLGRQPRLSFSHSNSFTTAPFQLIHCDLWTSPVPSFSGYKYYLIVLDDFSHYSWTFPLRSKSDTSSTLERFFHFVLTQFHVIIKCLQCDNGGEFLTSSLRNFFSLHGVSFRLSCPYTSPQNGKAERVIRSTNDIIRTILLQAHMPAQFWVEALHTSTHLLNRRPSNPINFHTPYFLLYGQHPTYDHLRTFGCLCFPNLYAITPNKLASRSTRCVFLSYILWNTRDIAASISQHAKLLFLAMSYLTNLVFHISRQTPALPLLLPHETVQCNLMTRLCLSFVRHPPHPLAALHLPSLLCPHWAPVHQFTHLRRRQFRCRLPRQLPQCIAQHSQLPSSPTVTPTT